MMKLSVMRAVVATLTEEGESPIADAIVAKWSHDPASVRYLRASANFVFTFRHRDRPYVLRFSDASERTPAAIRAEIAYIGHLSAYGVPAARPVRSLAGLELEQVQTPLGAFHAVAFEALQGTQYDIEELTPEQFSQWGSALGQLHRAARSYRGSGRPDWQGRLAALEQELPPGEQAARKALAHINVRVGQLSTDEHNFGLIHGDFELDNIIWSGNTIGIVDFDDSAWSWFVADIAFALRDLFDDRSDNVDWDDANLHAFIDGYRVNYAVAEEDIRRIPLYLQMHNIMTFAKLLKTLDIAEDEPNPQWLDRLRHKLIGKLDFYREQFVRQQ
jgi:Ser/Thr protein kinase RdoA (MazF antagonist)